MRPDYRVAFALAGATLLAASTSNEETLTVPLSGQAELNFAHPFGSTGDLDGSGLVKLAIAPAQRKVCYDFSLSDVGTPMMAHIRQAKALQNGPPIVSLFTGPGGELDGCAPANTRQLEDMIAHPDDYYVSIATTEFPDGALRGQLAS